MAQSGEQVEALFTHLNTQLRNGQHRKALKTAEEILKVAPSDGDALKCKLFVYVETSKFTEALALLQQHSLKAELPIEHAYCLYRLGRFRDALDALSSVEKDKAIAKLQLQAQLQYRLGAFGDAINTYQKLFQTNKVDTLELRTNVVAAYVSGGRAAEVPAVLEAMKASLHEGYELAFNAACAQLAAGHLDVAEEQLTLALRLGREALLDEDLGDDEIEQELAPLTVQAAYAAAAQQRVAEAHEALQGVLRTGVPDEATAAVAQSNAIALAALPEGEASGKKLFSELLKRMEAVVERGAGGRLVSGLEARLSASQREALLSNYALLLQLAGRPKAACEAAAALAARFPDSPIVPLVQAGILVRDGRSADAAAALGVAAESAMATADGSNRDAALAATLMRAQLASSVGDAQQALDALQHPAAAALAARPALVATIAALQEVLGDAAGALRGVEAALAAVHPPPAKRGRGGAGDEARQAAMLWLLQRAAELQLQVGDVRGAQERYHALRALSPTSPAASRIAGRLAAALATSNPGAVADLEADLPDVEPLPAAEVDRLEAGALGLSASRRRGGERAIGDGDKPPRKRKKRVRLPKGFDPDNPGPPPDPERWLPKWQRSNFKKKRGRRKDKEAVKGSQGAGKVDDSLDRTKHDVDVEEPVAGPPKPIPPRGAKSSSKKKGRR